MSSAQPHIVIDSTRERRFGGKPEHWIRELATARAGLSLLDDLAGSATALKTARRTS